MADVDGALLWSKEIQSVPEGVNGSGLSLAQQFFELGESHLDRIEIRAVGRQEQQDIQSIFH